MSVTLAPTPARLRKAIWLVAPAIFMLLLAPIVLFAGAANPPCVAATPAGGGATPTPVGTPPAGMFAAPLTLAPGRSYQVGATEYGGPGDPSSGDTGASGAFLPSYPDSFAELSVLDANPANGGTFTFQDANALDQLPYGTGLRVQSANQTMVLYKRDIGYGQGPTGQGPGAIFYRIDVWYASADQLGITKTPVDIQLAPPSGTGPILGVTPSAPPPGTTGVPDSCPPTGGPLILTDGPTATILPDGQATAPRDAPAAVKDAIAAGNEIIAKPYIWGGGHGEPLSIIDSGYDCSGATSFVLYHAGLLGPYALDATGLESWGQPGPGQYITVYANSAHAFIDIDGVVLDTAWFAPVEPTNPASGPRWQPESMIAAQYAADVNDGHGGFLQRHPQGA